MDEKRGASSWTLHCDRGMSRLSQEGARTIYLYGFNFFSKSVHVTACDRPGETHTESHDTFNAHQENIVPPVSPDIISTSPLQLGSPIMMKPGVTDWTDPTLTSPLILPLSSYRLNTSSFFWEVSECSDEWREAGGDG